jgi:hypothetical protein
VIWSEIGKFVGAKIASALIFIAVVAGCVWSYYNWDTLQSAGRVVLNTIIWISIVAALPWSSYLFMKPVMAFQSNLNSERAAAAVSVGMIAAYTMVGIAIAFWWLEWAAMSGFSRFVVIVGFIAAAAYNFVICESLARHVDR